MISKEYYEEKMNFMVRLPQDELTKNNKKVREVMNGYLSCGGSSEEFAYRILKFTLENTD